MLAFSMESCRKSSVKKFNFLPTHFSSYKDEGDVSLDPGHSGGGLVVALYLDPHHAALVHDFLDEPAVLADHFAD